MSAVGSGGEDAGEEVFSAQPETTAMFLVVEYVRKIEENFHLSHAWEFDGSGSDRDRSVEHQRVRVAGTV